MNAVGFIDSNKHYMLLDIIYGSVNMSLHLAATTTSSGMNTEHCLPNVLFSLSPSDILAYFHLLVVEQQPDFRLHPEFSTSTAIAGMSSTFSSMSTIHANACTRIS